MKNLLRKHKYSKLSDVDKDLGPKAKDRGHKAKAFQVGLSRPRTWVQRLRIRYSKVNTAKRKPKLTMITK